MVAPRDGGSDRAAGNRGPTQGLKSDKPATALVLTGKAAPSGVVWVDSAFVQGDTFGETRTVQSLVSICKMWEICNKGFDPDKEEGRVQSKKTEKGKEFERKADQEGFVDHHPDAGQFCSEHIEEAKKLTDFGIDKALEILRKRFGC